MAAHCCFGLVLARHVSSCCSHRVFWQGIVADLGLAISAGLAQLKVIEVLNDVLVGHLWLRVLALKAFVSAGRYLCLTLSVRQVNYDFLLTLGQEQADEEE